MPKLQWGYHLATTAVSGLGWFPRARIPWCFTENSARSWPGWKRRSPLAALNVTSFSHPHGEYNGTGIVHYVFLPMRGRNSRRETAASSTASHCPGMKSKAHIVPNPCLLTIKLSRFFRPTNREDRQSSGRGVTQTGCYLSVLLLNSTDQLCGNRQPSRKREAKKLSEPQTTESVE